VIVGDWPLFVVLVAVLVDLVIKVMALFLIPRNRKPSAAMAWILAVFFIPYIGLLFFALIGSPKLPKRRRDQQKRVNEILTRTPSLAGGVGSTSELPAGMASIVGMNYSLSSMPFLRGNATELQADYACSLTGMAEDIGRAQYFVHVEFYIVSFDASTTSFFRAMEAAVARGVVVRLLLDHVASIRTVGHRETLAELDRIGVDWRFMLPVRPLRGQYQRPDLRNHRKLLVIDGLVAHTGSLNLIDRSYNSAGNLKRGLQWQDLTVRVRGPAVASINALFLTDWLSETGDDLRPLVDAHAEAGGASTAGGEVSCQLVPSGPGFPDENNLRLFLALLYAAQERIIIASPYFVPDEAMSYAITSACQRGVVVELFVSEIGDQSLIHHAQQSYYGQLLEAGVVIWLYPPPFILHSKHLSVDGEVAVIGSSNMDIRSFSRNLELSLLVHSTSFVRDLRAVESDYRAVSRQLTLQEYRARPVRETAFDGVARLTSALQ
jgi:cardiolipin synthase A/B